MGSVAQCTTYSLLNIWNRLQCKACLNPSCIFQVRYRKPRCLGRAPSKDKSYFKKHYPTQKDIEENMTLYINYNTAVRSLVASFQEEIVHAKNSQSDNSIADDSTWNEAAHHQKCMQYNDVENERLRQLRMQRIEKERVEQEEALRLNQTNRQLEKERKDALLRQHVLQTIEQSKEWLTEENMEEKITQAVDNPINFNFSVDHRGIIQKRTPQVLPLKDVDELLSGEDEALQIA